MNHRRSIQIDPSGLAARVSGLRQQQRMTQDELAVGAGLSKRTIQDIERARRAAYLEDTLLRVARQLGLPLAALSGGEEAGHGSTMRVSELLEHADALDKFLLGVIRDHRHASRRLVHAEYLDLLTARIGTLQTTPAKYLSKWSEADAQRVLNTNMPTPSLTISVADDLQCIEYIHTGGTLKIRGPRLLWDCNCKTPELHDRSGGKKRRQESPTTCPIHSSPKGEAITTQFVGGRVLICWRGMGFQWRNEPEFWPPSIDSLLMISEILRSGAASWECRSVLDLGCGTGFLGVAVAKLNRSITKLDLADWLLVPLLYALANAARNLAGREALKVRPLLGLDLEWANTDSVLDSYDLVLCNPPYLPILKGYETLGVSSTVAGTDLLQAVILEGKSIGKQVYVQFSELARLEAEDAAKRAGVKLRQVGKSHEIPFRVACVWSAPDYLRALVEQRGLIVRSRDRHRYWHRVAMYRVV